MKRILIIGMFLLLSACCQDKIPMQSQLLHATLWYQNSAEFKALSYQAFNVAKTNIAKARVGKGYSIVVDVDETLLDNSVYQAEMIKNNKPFSVKSFSEWVARKSARPLPGAVEFLNYASTKGYNIFYVSNRDHNLDLNSTYENLKRAGFPIEKENMLFRVDSSSKEARRRQIIDAGNKIVMLIGDAMGDFNNNYYKKSTVERNQQVELDKEHFGVDYIVLPNPMYGKWESALYDHNYKLNESDKYQQRFMKLK